MFDTNFIFCKVLNVNALSIKRFDVTVLVKLPSTNALKKILKHCLIKLSVRIWVYINCFAI